MSTMIFDADGKTAVYPGAKTLRSAVLGGTSEHLVERFAVGWAKESA
jgi:hypothetical protein